MAERSTSKPKKFSPTDLSEKEVESVVEYYLGIHPKYLVFSATDIKSDPWKIAHDGINFWGFKPHMKELGIERPV